LEDRRVVELLVRRARRRICGAAGAEAFVQSPDHPGSTLYPSGDPTDLAAYLAAVSAEAA
jgi:hypothetical protein